MKSLFIHRATGRVAGFIVLETLLIALAVVLAAYARLGNVAIALLFDDYLFPKTLLVAGVCQVCLYYAELYDLRTVSDPRELFVRMAQALGAAAFILAGLYYWFPNLVVGRGVFLIAALLIIVFVTGWRVAFEWLSHAVRPSERLLLVGTSPSAVALAREIFQRRAELGVEIVGFVDNDPTMVGAPLINPGVIGTIDSIPEIVRSRGVDRVVVSLTDARGKLPMDKLLEMKLDDGVRFDHLASVYEQYTGKIAVENLRPSWLIFSEGFRKSIVVSGLKRAMDVIIAVVGLIALSPMLLLIALAVRWTSPGPILYAQQRVGHQSRNFFVRKFRSMQQDAEAATGPVWASKAGDPRVTTIGSFLRRSRADELPQLWNVLVGDMSFVGPRPERPEFVAELTRQIPFYRQRHVVRPGLTGWAQIRYTYGASTEDALQKLQYDLFYIKHLSIAMDVYIIFQTIRTVLLRKGA